MQTRNDRTVDALMEQLIETGPDGLAAAFVAMMNLAMRMERERHVGARAYERSAARTAYANGYKPKKIDTPAGTLTVQVPKSRGGETPFYPQAPERGRRSCRAVMRAVAQMYIQGVSTRDVEKVMAEFGLESLSSSQVSRAAALLDAELEAWRTRPGGLALPVPRRPVREGPHRRGGARRRHPLGDRRRRGRQAPCAGDLGRAVGGGGPRRRSMGAPSSTASWRAVCAACASSPATITQASAVTQAEPAARRASRRSRPSSPAARSIAAACSSARGADGGPAGAASAVASQRSSRFMANLSLIGLIE
jgi:hypothetical protein